MSLGVVNSPAGSTNIVLNTSLDPNLPLVTNAIGISNPTVINLVGISVSSGTAEFYPIIVNSPGSSAAKFYLMNFKNLTMNASSNSGNYNFPSGFVLFTGGAITVNPVSNIVTINVGANSNTFSLTSSNPGPNNLSFTAILAGP
jgi:hypothetical protein